MNHLSSAEQATFKPNLVLVASAGEDADEAFGGLRSFKEDAAVLLINLFMA